MNLESKIESILFYKNEPVKLAELSKILEASVEEVKAGLESLKTKLEGRGLSLLENSPEFSLVSSRENSGLLDKLSKEELSQNIGKAGLETLAIVLYKAPVSRRDIDYVRGVNSNFILRALTIRGLVERVEEKNSRSYTYKPTSELLALLGLKSINDLPKYTEIKTEIEMIEKSENTNE